MTLDVSSDRSPPGYSQDWYTVEADRALALLQSDRQTGLEAQQVWERQRQYGLNQLEEAGGRSNWAILIDQFKNIMLLLLIGVAIISGVLDLLDLRAGQIGNHNIPFKDTIAILAIVLLNGILGYMQESRAEKALIALKNMTSPQVRVLREGRLVEVESKQLVPGDVILLEAGVQVAADARLLEAVNLQVREAALTGEAHAVIKQAKLTLPEETSIGDRINLVFQGTEVVQGRGVALVTQTGMQTELGKIAAMLQAVEVEPTPLQQRMDQLSAALVTGSLILVAIVVIGGLIAAGLNSLRDLLEVGLSMAVAVVPEGLPAVITVTLALGTQRMVRRHALIRKLAAVETLGSVTHICSDKTGTLTQNKMVVQAVHPIANSFRITGTGYSPEGQFYFESGKHESGKHESGKHESGNLTLNLPIPNPQDYLDLQHLLLACVLCNDAALQKEQGEWVILGDPTEGALLTAAAKAGLRKDLWDHRLPRSAEIPFSSERKRMSVIVQGKSAQAFVPPLLPQMLFCKGSPELVLANCDQVQRNGQIESLTVVQRDRILAHNNALAERGLRVLGFCL